MVGLLTGTLGAASGWIGATIGAHGYIAIFVLMALEAAALPIPSEVVLPLVGYFGAMGEISVAGGFFAALLGSIAGMAFDYCIAYFFGKTVVYKHLHFFHIKRRSVEAFDAWFAKNGRFTVFIARLIPVVRGLINFPAGFAEMPLTDFFLYSIAGSAVWIAVLICVGYYAQGLLVDDVYYLVVALALFFAALYALYRVMMKKILGELKK